MTTVVHVNDPRFRDNPAAVYIGRACPRAADPRCHRDSLWGNPCKRRNVPNESRENVIVRFRQIMRERLGWAGPVMNAPVTPAEWARMLRKLDGKVLGCWCKPQACHGDVLVELLSELKERE